MVREGGDERGGRGESKKERSFWYGIQDSTRKEEESGWRRLLSKEIPNSMRWKVFRESREETKDGVAEVKWGTGFLS